MRVSRLRLIADGMPAGIQISPQGCDSDRNWLTIVTGENGTRKSLILRLIAGAALGRSSFKSNNHSLAETNIYFAGSPAPRTFALSGTPNDRFPVASGIPVARALTTFDMEAYSYFGPRYAGSVASRVRMISGVIHSILLDPARTAHRAPIVLALLRHLGYSSRVQISMSPHKKLQKTIDSKREAVLRQMANELDNKLVGRESGFGSSLRGYISTLMIDGRENNAATEQLGRSHEISIDFEKVNIWEDNVQDSAHEIAQLLAAGFLIADELLLSRISIPDEQPDAQPRSHWVASNDLSSGQWQLINCLLNLTLNIEDESLILVDEPENSLHPEWQREYISLLKLTMSSVKGCHAILATHSPLIAAGVSPEEGNLLRLHRTPSGHAIEVSAEQSVFGWLPGDVLQERFDMDSARAPQLVEVANQALELLKEPRHDGGQLLKLHDLGRSLSQFASGLPTNDPLLPALEAIIEMASLGTQTPQ